MWLIIRLSDNTVFQIEEKEPPDGAYKEDFFAVKYWDGAVPGKESADPETGAIIPGDPDPTLSLSVDELRRLAYIEAKLTPDLSMELLLDDIVADLNGLLSKDTKDKIKALNDERQKIKDKYPKPS